MCFRPPSAESNSIQCPECGKKVNVVMGSVPNVCPFCEADLSAWADSINAAGNPGMPLGAPAASKGPGALEPPSPPQP